MADAADGERSRSSSPAVPASAAAVPAPRPASASGSGATDAPGANGSASSASSGSGSIAASAAGDRIGALCAPPGETLLQHIERLRVEKKDLKAERVRLTKELKNATKRKTRLKKKARQLSDADLVAVMQMRSESAAPQTAATQDRPPEPGAGGGVDRADV